MSTCLLRLDLLSLSSFWACDLEQPLNFIFPIEIRLLDRRLVNTCSVVSTVLTAICSSSVVHTPTGCLHLIHRRIYTSVSLPTEGSWLLFRIPLTLLPIPPPLAPGPSVVWMGPRGAETGTGRGVVSDRNLRGWPRGGLGPSFLKGGWAKAGTQCRRRCPLGPSSWSPPASSWPFQTRHKSPAKVRWIEGGCYLFTGKGSPGRGYGVRDSHWFPSFTQQT